MKSVQRCCFLVLFVIVASHSKATLRAFREAMPPMETLKDAMEVFSHSPNSIAEQGQARSSRATNAQKWWRIISEYAQDAVDDDRESQANWVPHPIPVNLPVGGGNGRIPESLPVLVVPLAVPYPVPAQCTTQKPEIPAVTGAQLVQLYKAQTPTNPSLRPVVYPRPKAEVRTGPGQAYLPPANKTECQVKSRPVQNPVVMKNDTKPERPVFNKPMMLRAQLTVPRSDYTEDYTSWWDPATGASRVEFQGVSTTTYRMILPDGQMQKVEVTIDRSSGKRVRRCSTMPPEPIVKEKLSHPALPNIDNFTFVGYMEVDGVSVERWQQVIQGGVGEMGAARGEALNYTHELLLTRTEEQAPKPMKYSTTIDSSVLGPNSDGFEHTFVEVQSEDPDPSLFNIDIEQACDEVDAMENTLGNLAKVDPLREFTMYQRDPRYDEDMDVFKSTYGRKYIDSDEEAVRKNVYIQHARFCASANRQDAPFSLELNFLGDRLDLEIESLLGVTLGKNDGFGKAEMFPHSSSKLKKLEDELPKEFDWRTQGAVSPVRYQGSCSSCWAFAVAGAVEGALFKHTGKLVPLSEQCLVDCAQSHGGNGCKGTWPSHAYDYIQDKGLPALDEYTPYGEMVLECQDKRVPPVTHISSHVNVTSNSVPALQVAIKDHAPAVVIIDAKAKSFIFYKTGVLYDERCVKGPDKKLNHAVLAVGWGEEDGETYLILKNSFSAGWGEGGYVRVHAAANTCGVTTLPSYPKLEASNIDREDLATLASSRSNASEDN